MQRVLAIPDLHFPFHNAKTLARVYDLADSLEPTTIVQLGDIYDAYAFSRYPRSHDIMTPKEELSEARLAAEALWKNLRKAAGNRTKLIQLMGNHDVRPKARLQEKYPEIASLLDIDHLWKFKDVHTIMDDRCKFEIEGVIYTHGFRSKLGDHMKFLGKSVVRGHSHRAGVVFLNQWDKLLFEMECGYLADDKAEPLKYTHTQQAAWIQAVGFVDEHGPRIIPLK